MIVGTAALLAVAAVLALGIGAVLRRGAAAVDRRHRGDRAAVLLRRAAGRAARRRRGTGCCGSPRQRDSPSSRVTRGTRSSTPAIRRGTGISRWRRGLASRCSASGPPSRLSLAGYLLRQERRMTQAPPAQRAYLATPRARRTSYAGRVARRVDEGAHAARHRLAAARRCRADRDGERRGGRGRQVPVRALRRRPRQDQPDRDLPWPGGHRHRGRAGRQQRIQHRHDPRHAVGDARPGHRAGGQGSRPHRPGPGSPAPSRCSARCWPGG